MLFGNLKRISKTSADGGKTDFGGWAASAGNDAFLAFAHTGVQNNFTATDIMLMDAIGWNTVAPGTTIVSSTTIQNDFLPITRTALPLDQATTIANAINAGAETLTDFINTTVASAKDTTGAILSIFQIMTGTVLDSASLSSEVQLISGLNSSLNTAFGWEAIGASLADSPFSTQYASLYKNLPDTSFITNVYSEVFGSTPGAVTLQALQNELTILKNYYAGATDANDPTGINRAHGNFIADMLHQASDIKFGKYYAASVVFMKDAAAGTAAYGGSLFAQPAPVFAQAVSDSHPSVTLVGVGDPSAAHNSGLL